MKIVTLNAPFFHRFSRTSRSPAISKGGCVYYPIWLGYCTGVLDQAGHEVKLIDSTAAGYSYEDVYQILQEFRPDVIVIDTVTASITNDKKVAARIKTILPHVKIIAVGTHVTALPERTLKDIHSIDAIARGEYDHTVRDYVAALEKNEPLENILGLTFRKIEGEEEKIVNTPPRPELTPEELDKMPFVSETYSKHLKIKDYFYPSVLYPEVTIITGRGCKFRCTFCVDGDTTVATKENEKIRVDRISEVLDKYLDREGKKVQGYDLLNTQNKNMQIWSNGEFVKVKNISRIKMDKRLRIKVSNGTSIEMTADHVVPVLRGNESFDLRAGEISKGDKVKFSNPLPEGKEVKHIDLYKGLIENANENDLKDIYIHGVGEYFDFLKEIKAQEFEEKYKRLKNGWKQNNILPISVFRELEQKYGLPEAIAEKLEIGGKNTLPLPMILPVTKELMTIIGFFVSEGNYNNFNIAISKSDYETRQKIIECIKTTFPKTYITETKGSAVRGAQIYFGGKLVYLLFRKILGIPAGSPNKKLPWIVFNSNNDLQNTCLRALYSGDGSWDKARKIKYYTSSKVLTNQLMALLAKKGINYSLSMQDNRGTAFIHRPVKINHQIHRITINDWYSRQRFVEEIGFFGKRQQEIVKQQAEHKPNRVAVLEKLKDNQIGARELAQKLGITHGNVRQTIAELAREGAIEKVEIKTSGFIKQMQYKAIAQTYKNMIPEFLEVISVEEVTHEGYVYDVETENNHFTANNILVHNCKWPQLLTGHNYRARSIKNVVDEFEWIEKNLPYVKDIMIEDDTLTQDKERTKELCAEIKRRGVNIAWTCNSRADLDYDTMKAMKEGNCRLMCVGFESADQTILNNIKKGIIVKNVRPFVANAKKAGLLIHGCFMMGNKGETPDTIKKTIEMAKELDPDTAQFYPVMVYPGTEAFEWARENNYLTTENWSEWLLPDGTHNTIVSTEHLTARELVRWCDKARIAFYLRPKFITRKLKQVFFHPIRELPRFLISTYIFSKYLAKEVSESFAEKTGQQRELPGFASCKAN